MKLFIQIFFTISILLSSTSWAKFDLDQMVFVGLPATNVKDDAFIVGKVTKVLANGDVQIAVEDYVHGHDYGSTCTPVPPASSAEKSPYGDAWEVWEDTTQLDRSLEYVINKDLVMPYREGQHAYIERNNVWIVFGRWMSDAPILPVERLKKAKGEAANVWLEDIKYALDIAIAHRYAFYEDGWGRPYWPYERVAKLHQVIDAVEKELNADAALKKLWFSNKRSVKQVEESSRVFFLIAAMDKAVDDALDTLYEDLEKADPALVKSLEARLKKLGKEKR